MSYSDAFLGNFAQQLLSYGVGRMLDYADMPMARSVSREAAENNNRFSSFVMGIVTNPLFQMSRNNHDSQQ